MSDIALPPIVFILGGPGSGKGTQCEALLEAAERQSVAGIPNKIFHVNVGGILRGAQTEYRRQLAENCVTENMAKAGPVLEEMLAQGQILPSWVTVTLMLEEFRGIARQIEAIAKEQPGYTGAILVDGFPRSVENLESFEQGIGVARRLIVITCDDEAMVQRVLSRGASSGREDDQSVETVRKRLAVFKSQTLETMSQFTIAKSADEAVQKAQDKRIGITVDGDRPIPEVTVDFIKAFTTLISKI